MKTILIIEDIRTTISDVIYDIKNLDFEITISGNVQDASKKLVEKKYDCILLDWRLPLKPDNGVNDKGAVSILNLLIEKNLNEDTPLIVLTGQKTVIDYELLEKKKNYLGAFMKLLSDDVIDLIKDYFQI